MLLFVCALTLSGCAGRQSALEPAAREAHLIAQLWWWMFKWWRGGVVGYDGPELLRDLCTASALFAASDGLGGHRWWVVFPVVLLTVLLCFGLSLLPPLLARPPVGSLVIDVEGVQWWWRVKYPATQIGQRAVPAFETANEICVPVNQPVEFRLRSHDVIHAFWIPAFAGKVDMIPGRTTRLTVHPFRMGRYRGACAEYCGESHALMNFDVRVVSSSEFEKWLIHQASPAVDRLTLPQFKRKIPRGCLASRGNQRAVAAWPCLVSCDRMRCVPYGARNASPRQRRTRPDALWQPAELGGWHISCRSPLYRRLASLDGASQAGGPHAQFWRSATRAARTTGDFFGATEMNLSVAEVDREASRSREQADRLSRVWEIPRGWRYWSSVNNSQVGLWYTLTAFAFFFFAGILALLIRIQLAVPNNHFLSADQYNQVFHHARHGDDVPVCRAHL